MRPRRSFWRSGRIVRAGTPGGFNSFRMIPRFSQWCSRVRDGTILPGRHFSCLTPAVASAVRRPGGRSRRTPPTASRERPAVRRPGGVNMVASRLGGACTTIRRPGGLRFGDVISSRIVRDGLARIEFVWIVPGRARIARAEVDLGEQTWNFVNRPRGEPPWRGGVSGAGRRHPWSDAVEPGAAALNHQRVTPGAPQVPCAPSGRAPRSASTSLNPRDRRVTRENVPLADVLAGYPAISCVRAASERYGRRCHGAGAVAGASAVVACRPATALLTGCGGLYPDNVQKTSRNTFSAGLQRCGLSKSATKARIEPERARRIVGIPRFSSRPIPPRSAFVADLDTTPPRLVPGAPPVPPR